MLRKLRAGFAAAGRWAAALETGLLAVFTTALVLLSAAQIVLRNLGRPGIPWGNDLAGLGLLWLTLIGGLAATGAARHISIDLLSHLLPRRALDAVRVLLNLFAAAVCAVLAWQAARYLEVLRTDAAEQALLLGVPKWRWQTILPVAFGLMAYRFFSQAAQCLWRACAPRPPAKTRPS